MKECCAKAATDATSMVKSNIIQAVLKRHEDGSNFDKEWSNHHGLMRCDCDELIEFLKDQN